MDLRRRKVFWLLGQADLGLRDLHARLSVQPRLFEDAASRLAVACTIPLAKACAVVGQAIKTSRSLATPGLVERGKASRLTQLLSLTWYTAAHANAGPLVQSIVALPSHFNGSQIRQFFYRPRDHGV